MLTVMCPNCRHRFPASSGCCEPASFNSDDLYPSDALDCSNFYGTTGGLLIPRGYTNGGGSFINAPTIVHGPAIIQQTLDPVSPHVKKCHLENAPAVNLAIPKNPGSEEHRDLEKRSSKCRITTTCDLTGGSVTITTPGIQSGGCLQIQARDSSVDLHQTPRIEIRPKLNSNGGCLLTKMTSNDEEQLVEDLEEEQLKCHHQFFKNHLLTPPPSGCQEPLPGNRCNLAHPQGKGSKVCQNRTHKKRPIGGQNANCRCHDAPRLLTCEDESMQAEEQVAPPGVKIQLNATLELPANLGQCTFNITATTTTSSSSSSPPPAAPPPTGTGTSTSSSSGGLSTNRSRNSFNGGGLVQLDGTGGAGNERRDGAPSTPVSWLMPCPWNFDNYVIDKDVTRLSEVKRLLQTCGWYHEGLSWQQSENLLKDTPVGRWLMRDSSDSRFTFAVSVQTARGPTSVRVHYLLGQFRLDAELALAYAMPVFNCPIRMLEYYVDYSKKIDEHRNEVWVDYSGQIYSQIYLTKPLVKGVRSLSHLARLVVNRSQLKTDHLPPLIRSYLAEYPYTL